MEYPLVSAIVVCYNHARFVTECLESVRAQNYPNLQLIINDDASRDDSVAVIKAWLGKTGIRGEFLRSDKNQGICRSLNRTLSCARGKYVSGIASDDVWLPGKLLRQVELMEGLPAKVGVVYSDALQMDEGGKLLPQKFLEAHRSFETVPAGNIADLLWAGNFIPAMTTLVRRECYSQVGTYDESLFYEDWDMWLRIAQDFEFCYSDQVSAKYRLVGTSMVRSQFARINQSMCQVCLKHLRGGRLKGESRRAAARQLYERAIYSFEHASPGYRTNLLQAARYRPSAGIGLRLLLACCGLGAAPFERIRLLCGRGEIQKNASHFSGEA